MSASPIRDLAKALRTTFLSSEQAYEALQPPSELVALIDHCTATQHVNPPSESDVARLSDALVDITGDVSRGKERGAQAGRTNAWLIALQSLRHLHGDAMNSDFVLKLLWPTLIRKVLLQSGDLQLSRDGITAAKTILVWSCRHEGDHLGPIEKEVLADYIAFTDIAEGDADPRFRGTKARDRGSVHLEDVLLAMGKQRPKALFSHLAVLLPSKPAQRSAILRLIGDFSRTHPAQAHHALSTKLFDALLLAVLLDVDMHVVQLALASIVAILPRILASLEPLLPSLFVAYARALSLVEVGKGRAEVHAQHGLEENSEDKAAAQKADLRDGLTWQHSKGKVPSLDDLHPIEYLPLAPMQHLFGFLYGILPCNLAAFLRSPLDWLKDKQWLSPFADPSRACFDPGILRDRCHISLQAHCINPGLLFGSASTELADLGRLGQLDAAELQFRCHSYTVDSHQNTRKEANTVDETQAQGSELRSTPSLSQLENVDLYVARRRESTLSSATSVSMPSPVQQRSSSRARFPEGQQHATRIAHLEREASLLRAEVAYELYLKQQQVDRLGVLHRDRIKEAAGDAERQALHDALRIYKARLNSAEGLVKQMRSEAAMSKAQSRDWAKRQQSRIAVLKETDRQAKDREKSDEAKLQEARGTITAQAKELEVIGNKLFDLENQAKLDAPKLQERAQLEARLHRLTQFLLAWDEDMSGARNQRKRMAEIVSEWQKATDLQAADERIIEALRAELKTAQLKAAQIPEARPLPLPDGREESASARGYAVLREQYRLLRQRAQDLEEQLADLRAGATA